MYISGFVSEIEHKKSYLLIFEKKIYLRIIKRTVNLIECLFLKP